VPAGTGSNWALKDPEPSRATTIDCEGAPLDAPPEYRSTLTLESSPVAVPAVPCTTGVEPPAAAMRGPGAVTSTVHL